MSSLIASVSKMKSDVSLPVIIWCICWSIGLTTLAAIFSVLWSIALMGAFTPWIIHGTLMKPVLWQSSDILYDMIKNLIPSHFLLNLFEQHKTEIKLSPFLNVDKNLTIQLKNTINNQPNILGILFGCCIVGMTMSTMRKHTFILTNTCLLINDIMMKMSEVALWLAPLCSVSIIVEDILSSNIAIRHLLNEILFLIEIIFFGLFVYATQVLSLIYIFINKNNPMKIMLKSGEALIAAFATSSR
ncbi:unnamed protein product [Gordionus sp. m RMFG-2023]